MMDFREYRRHDATALAQRVQQGEVTASELLECAIARAQQINPSINAIVTPMYGNARRYVNSRSLQGPFAGVPIVLKDLLAAFAGVPMSNGSRAFRYNLSSHHSTVVQRLCDSGMVIVGKTNTPELGLLGTTENREFGPTRNPWDPARSAGGSSGGTAAAVAAGIVPIGSAGDGGGSIRIPAACCGLFGLKPGRAVVPTGPDYGEVWDGAVSEHVLTRSVRDSAAVLDLLAGPDAASHVALPKLQQTYLSALDEPLPRLRIAFSSQSPVGGAVDVECRDAVEKVAQMLTDLGHDVEEAAPEIDATRLVKAYADIYLAHVTADIAQVEKKMGRRFVQQNFEPSNLFIARLGRRFSAADFVQSRLYWVELRRQLAAFHSRYDCWLTPVLAAPPYKLGEMRSSRLEEMAVDLLNHTGLHRLVPLELYYQLTLEQMRKVPFTQIANLTGQPAMSVPLMTSKTGLPIGVQFVGPVASEHRLLQLAHQLEQAHPWFERVPQ